MARGELENRDREEIGGLADLPEPLARERGELSRTRKQYSDVPPDMAGSDAARAAAAQTGLGTPQMDFTVRSVYDSRPVNAVDFILPAIARFVFDACGGTTFDGENAQLFQVPFGRVVVLRKIEFMSVSTDQSGGSMISANAPADFMVQLTRNSGVILPITMTPQQPVASASYLSGIPVNCPDSLETFQIFDELETFGLNFLRYSAASLDDNTFYVPVKFHGNLLVKTGTPANFEIANAGPGKKARAVASAADIYSAPVVGQRSEAAMPLSQPQVLPQGVPVQRTQSARAEHFRRVEAGTKKDTFRRVRR